MDMVTGLAFALAAGLTLGGIAALTIEIVVGSPVGFTRPYVDHHRIVRSLALTAIVGPYMLLADALIARGVTPHVIGGADVAAELDAKRAIDQGSRLAAGL